MRLREITLGLTLICMVGLSPLAAQEVEIAASVAFTEGPAVDREGNVYFTEIMSQRIMKLGADGLLTTLSRAEQCGQWSAD